MWCFTLAAIGIFVIASVDDLSVLIIGMPNLGTVPRTTFSTPYYGSVFTAPDTLYLILCSWHLTPFARKDRHAKIGEGMIGLDAIVRIINHPALKHLPFYLETPNELDGYAKEIEILRERYVG